MLATILISAWFKASPLFEHLFTVSSKSSNILYSSIMFYVPAFLAYCTDSVKKVVSWVCQLACQCAI